MRNCLWAEAKGAGAPSHRILYWIEPRFAAPAFAWMNDEYQYYISLSHPRIADGVNTALTEVNAAFVDENRVWKASDELDLCR